MNEWVRKNRIVGTAVGVLVGLWPLIKVSGWIIGAVGGTLGAVALCR